MRLRGAPDSMKRLSMGLADRDDRKASLGFGTQLRWGLFILAGLAVIGMAVRLVVRPAVRAYVIGSGSMAPTLLPGERVFFNMAAYGLRDPVFDTRLGNTPQPQRGDIAVVEWGDAMIVSRIIGLPGEEIAIRDRQVFINGAPIAEPYAVHSDPKAITGPRDNLAPVTIPPGALFVMGDNRDRSYDSRFRGNVSIEQLRGRAGMIYWSSDNEQGRIRWERIGKTAGAPDKPG
jgi:signal peptidase I